MRNEQPYSSYGHYAHLAQQLKLPKGGPNSFNHWWQQHGYKSADALAAEWQKRVNTHVAYHNQVALNRRLSKALPLAAALSDREGMILSNWRDYPSLVYKVSK